MLRNKKSLIKGLRVNVRRQFIRGFKFWRILRRVYGTRRKVLLERKDDGTLVRFNGGSDDKLGHGGGIITGVNGHPVILAVIDDNKLVEIRCTTKDKLDIII